VWLAVLEQERPDERELDRRPSSEVVVGGQQLAHSLKTDGKREEGLVPSMSIPAKPGQFNTEEAFKHIHMSPVWA
jgi:hypothetical protein